MIWKAWNTRIHMFSTIMGGLGGFLCQEMERTNELEGSLVLLSQCEG